MPKDANGTVPVSKSQRNKAARIAKLAKQGGKSYGGKCSRCGQESSSSTPGKAHLGCPEDGSLFGFELSYRLRAPFLRKWMGPNGEGMWLSKEDYTRFESEVDSFLLSVRNFSVENQRWENAYGEPINFLTREVIVETSIQVEESPPAEENPPAAQQEEQQTSQAA